MRKPYHEPTLTKFGGFRELTLDKQGKEQTIADLAGPHETCEEHAGGAAGCPAFS